MDRIISSTPACEDLSALGESLYTCRMSPLSSDTHPKMEQIQLEVIRRMPVWKKLSVLNGLNETVRTLAIAGIRQRNPDASPEQVQRILADLLLGKELAQKVYDHAR